MYSVVYTSSLLPVATIIWSCRHFDRVRAKIHGRRAVQTELLRKNRRYFHDQRTELLSRSTIGLGRVYQTRHQCSTSRCHSNMIFRIGTDPSPYLNIAYLVVQKKNEGAIFSSPGGDGCGAYPLGSSVDQSDARDYQDRTATAENSVMYDAASHSCIQINVPKTRPV